MSSISGVNFRLIFLFFAFVQTKNSFGAAAWMIMGEDTAVGIIDLRNSGAGA